MGKTLPQHVKVLVRSQHMPRVASFSFRPHYPIALEHGQHVTDP